jgi:hypothetical protein
LNGLVASPAGNVLRRSRRLSGSRCHRTSSRKSAIIFWLPQLTRHWLEFIDWAAAILAEPLRIADVMAQVPERPGTWVFWDEDAVKRYRTA